MGATIRAVLHAGTTLTVLRTVGSWQEVRTQNGKTGWVAASHVGQ